MYHNHVTMSAYFSVIDAKVKFLDALQVWNFFLKFFGGVLAKKIKNFMFSGNVTTWKACKYLFWYESFFDELSQIKLTLERVRRFFACQEKFKNSPFFGLFTKKFYVFFFAYVGWTSVEKIAGQRKSPSFWHFFGKKDSQSQFSCVFFGDFV